jgi:hypothetical protein
VWNLFICSVIWTNKLSVSTSEQILTLADSFLKGIAGIIGKRLEYLRLVGQQTSGDLPYPCS